MSLMLTAYLLETYGPRLGREELAAVLGVTPRTLENKVYTATLGVATYRDQGKLWADARDVAEYLDECRAVENSGKECDRVQFSGGFRLHYPALPP
jgi:hypothetical protein